MQSEDVDKIVGAVKENAQALNNVADAIREHGRTCKPEGLMIAVQSVAGRMADIDRTLAVAFSVGKLGGQV